MCLCLIAFKLARVKNFYKNQDLKGFATLTQSNKVKYMLVFLINYFNLNQQENNKQKDFLTTHFTHKLGNEVP